MASRILSQTSMNVFAAAREYALRMLSSPGLKVLVLDETTSDFLAPVISHTEILTKEVVLLEKIRGDRKDMRHLRAVFFVRPTAENMDTICRELEAPKYASYDLYFSNTVSRDDIERLARADTEQLVAGVREHYFDTFACNPDMWTVEASPTAPLVIPNRASEALLSVILGQKRRPAVIRYSGSSERARAVATSLAGAIRSDPSRFDSVKRGGTTTAVLILDRLEDAATPLLTQWTYQSMLHNAFGIVNGVLSTADARPGDSHAAAAAAAAAATSAAAGPGPRTPAPDGGALEGQHVLSLLADSFWQRHIYSTWGDVCKAVKGFVAEFRASGAAAAAGGDGDLSVDDMKRLIEELPALRRAGGEVNKHVALMSALSGYIKKRNAYKVSEVEQDIVTSAAAPEQLKAVQKIVADPATPADAALRVALLYVLRHGAKDGAVPKIALSLQAKGVGPTEVALLDYVAQLSTKSTSGGGDSLFGTAKVRDVFGSALKGLKDVACVFTQHEVSLLKLIQQLTRGKLSADAFPSADASTPVNPAFRPTEVFVYVVGGVTYEEAVAVAAFNDPTCPAAKSATPTGQDPTGGQEVKVILGGDMPLTPARFVELLGVYARGR